MGDLHYETYKEDVEMLVKLHYMAAEFDNPFLRRVADRLNELIKDRDADYSDGK